MKIGILGLPNVGKSTLFNAITASFAECANYPFCTIEPNIGTVAVPDERLLKLGQLFNTKKIINAVIEFVDIAGLVKGASAGEGLGNKFLSHLHAVDAIIQVVRCFDDSNVIHVSNSIDPIDDIETINTELILSDLATIKKKHEKYAKAAKNGDKDAIEKETLLSEVEAKLNKGEFFENRAENNILNDLLTTKPMIYCCNISEKDIGRENENKYVNKVKEHFLNQNNEILCISAKIEEEITKLDQNDRKMFLSDLGLSRSGLDNIIIAGYKILNLISFLTAGEKEVRAWTIKRGTLAPQAAGKIHTDFERGFIRAEVISYEDLIAAGSLSVAKEKGKIRSEGKEYVVKDGDVVNFRFNV